MMCIPISVPFSLKKKVNLLHAVVSSLANEEFVFSSLWAKKCKMFWRVVMKMYDPLTFDLCVSSRGPLRLLQEQLQLSVKTNGPSGNC